MGDALSNISKDNERGRRYEDFLDALKAYLKYPTPENRSEAIRLAKRTDAIVGGYFGGQTGLTFGIEKMLDGLRDGDKGAWGKFLFSFHDRWDFSEYKKLSPFVGKLVIAVKYGYGFVHFHGDVEGLVDSIIRNGKGWQTYGGDDYIVAVDMPREDAAEVYWVGGFDKTGPTKAE